MNKIVFEDFISQIKMYNPDEEEIITKAYKYAEKLHEGQKRQSGEDYIIHPLNVAYILSEMHADRDTICAALLHDVIEDTRITKEDIERDFNKTIANLVDGVTKISGLNFSTSKQEINMANTRKIIMSITEDIRIIIIKLADRLHNMRTLEYKSRFKQQENALETMDIFVPLAYYIGAYRIKNELEDLSFRYLKPEKYLEYELLKNGYEEDYSEQLQEMLYKIKTILNDNNIPNEIKVRTKNIYGIYKNKDKKDIHDLFALKIMVDQEYECYNTLRLVHKLYHPVNSYFKDFICNPKTNKYQSLHTTVFGPKNKLVQTQIRTHDMDRVASFGFAAYWDIYKGDARDVIQKELKEDNQFVKSLVEINDIFTDNQEFVIQVKSELFNDNVYVLTPKGDVKQLPKGATIIDFAYSIHTDIGNQMIGALVNDLKVPVDYELKSNDRIRILTSPNIDGPNLGWINIAKTSTARTRIKEYFKNKI